MDDIKIEEHEGRKVFYIDVGDMTDVKIQKYIDEIKEKYKFSSNIGLYFVDADHGFNVDTNTWNEIYHQIDKVIQ